MMSKTGWASVWARLMARSTSPVAVCRARASVISALRASSSVNRRTFWIAMTAWSAKVFRSSICRSEKGPAWSRATLIVPIARPSRSIGTATMLLKVVCLASAPNLYSGSAWTSGMCWTAPLRAARPRGAPPIRRDRKRPAEGLDALGGEAVVGHEVEQRPVEPEEVAELGLAELRRAPGDRVEDRLDVGRRARDDAQDLAGRGLLLEGLGEIAVPSLELLEQADVLDGDDGLIGEGLQERRSACR